jgi:hypothetical protein
VYIYLPDDLLRVELAYNTEPFLEAHNVDVKFIHFNANLQIHESKKMAKRKWQKNGQKKVFIYIYIYKYGKNIY